MFRADVILVVLMLFLASASPLLISQGLQQVSDPYFFVESVGGEGSERPYESASPVIQLVDGGFLVAGETSTASFEVAGTGILLFKLEEDGGLGWARIYEERGDERGGAIKQTPDGGFILVGQTTSYGSGGEIFAIKTDSSGKIEWSATYGGDEWDYAYAVYPTGDGYIIGAGTDSFGAGSGDLLLMKIDSSGNLVWAKTYGGDGDDSLYYLHPTSDGGFLLLGQTTSFNSEGRDILLIKVDSDGNILWQKIYGGSEDEWARDVKETIDGGYILLGYTLSFGAEGSRAGDVMVIKLDSRGNVEWAKRYEGAKDEWAYSILVENWGYLVVAETQSYSVDDILGDSDIWILQLNGEGEIISQRVFGGEKDDWPWKAIKTSDHGYIIAGETHSFGEGKSDFWILKLDSEGDCPGCGYKAETSSKSITIHPKTRCCYAQENDVTHLVTADFHPFKTQYVTNIVSLSTQCSSKASYDLIYVDDDEVNPCEGNIPCYKSIHKAVNDLNEGGTIIVYPGTYEKNLLIDKPLTLKSRYGSSTSTITPTSRHYPTIQVSSDGVKIEGFTIIDRSIHDCTSGIRAGGAIFMQDSSPTSGNKYELIGNRFVSEDAHTCAMVYVEDHYYQDNGLVVGKPGARLVIKDNLFDLTGLFWSPGLWLEDPHDALISDNLFAGNPGYSGMGIQEGSYVLISSNTFKLNTLGAIYLAGLKPPRQNEHIWIVGNLITRGSEGVFSYSVQPEAENNDIKVRLNNIERNSHLGIYADEEAHSSSKMEAENNWWNSKSGPLSDRGDFAEGELEYTPWLTSPLKLDGDGTGVIGEVILDAGTGTYSFEKVGLTVEVEASGRVELYAGLYDGNPGIHDPQLAGKFIDLFIDDVSRIESLKIGIRYSDSDISGLLEESLKPVYWDGSNWRECSENMLDADNNIVYCIVTSSSIPSLSDLQGLPMGIMGTPLASSWSMFHRDSRHSGRTQYSGPPSNQVKWLYSSGTRVRSSPTIGPDGAIYFASEDGLYALNPDGALKWSYSFQNGYEWLQSSPAVASDGTIYVGAYDGYLYAFNPDGTLKWRFKTGNTVTSSPIVGLDGTIYFGSWDGYLYALNPDGSLKWKTLNPDETFAILVSPALSLDEETVYVGAWGGSGTYFYAVNSEDGSLKWRFKFEDGFNIPLVESSPTVGDDGVVYVGVSDPAGKAYLYAFRDDGGSYTLLWRFQLDGSRIVSTPAVGLDGTIYFAGPYCGGECGYGYLYALNPDGTLKWRFKLGDESISSPAVDRNGVIYVGCYDGSLYAVQDLGDEGVLRWRFEAEGGIASSPSIGLDGTLYIGSDDGNLYAINTAPTTITTTKVRVSTSSITITNTVTTTHVSVETRTFSTIYSTTQEVSITRTLTLKETETVEKTITASPATTITMVSLQPLPVLVTQTFTETKTLPTTIYKSMNRMGLAPQPAPPSPPPLQPTSSPWLPLTTLLVILLIALAFASKLIGVQYALTPFSEKPVKGFLKIGEEALWFRKAYTASTFFKIPRGKLLAWEEGEAEFKERRIPLVKLMTVEGDYVILYPKGIPRKHLEGLEKIFS